MGGIAGVAIGCGVGGVAVGVADAEEERLGGAVEEERGW